MTSPVRVASFETVVPGYRHAFLERIAQRGDVELTCFHGAGRRGYSVPDDGRPLPVAERRIANFYWPGAGARVAWQTGLVAVLRGDFEVVMCAEAVHNLTTWAILLLRRAGGYRVVLSGHGLRPLKSTGWREPIRLALRRVLGRCADTMLVYSDRSAHATVAAGLPREKIFVAGNTLDTGRLIALSEAAADADADAPRPFTLLYVGRLYAAKRVDVLLEAASLLRQRGRDVRAVIVGDGRERGALERLAGPDSHVRFVGAEYDEARMARRFAEADLLVLPDAVGLGAVHAFSNAVPVLTARNGRSHGPEVDYVADGINGVLVDDVDAESFAAAIATLMDDPERLRKLRAGALETARALSMERMADGFVAAVRHARSRRKAAAS